LHPGYILKPERKARRQDRMRNNIITRVAMTLIVLGILSLVFCIGTQFGQASSGLQTTGEASPNINTSISPTVQSRVIETHTVEYVEKPVTVVEYIERVKRVPIELRNFNTLEELEQWMEGRQNVTTIRLQSDDILVDCDDYALELQQKAIVDGYVMSFQIIDSDKYNSLFESSKLPPDNLHAINLVIIRNTAHYIEPQTGEVVFAAQLD